MVGLKAKEREFAEGVRLYGMLTLTVFIWFAHIPTWQSRQLSVDELGNEAARFSFVYIEIFPNGTSG